MQTLMSLEDVAEVWFKILIRRLTWHWECDRPFRCFRHFACITKTKADRESLTEAGN